MSLAFGDIFGQSQFQITSFFVPFKFGVYRRDLQDAQDGGLDNGRQSGADDILAFDAEARMPVADYFKKSAVPFEKFYISHF
jgi:hypothetical protein